MPAQSTEHVSFGSPDEVREFPHGRAEIVKVGDVEIGRLILEPGWRWSNDVKPIAGTDSCQTRHTGYCLSGQMVVKFDDGSEISVGPGDVMLIEPGHDAWTVGDEPVVVVDWYGASNYAR